VRGAGQAARANGAETRIVSVESMRFLRGAASAALIALFFLCLLWELWLAPLRPGGSLIALKALPLVLPLNGILRGQRYVYQWSSMLILAYFAEGVMRAWSERGTSQLLAGGEVTLSILFFSAAVTYARLTRGVN
jgi:uncharacterized membrane protein